MRIGSVVSIFIICLGWIQGVIGIMQWLGFTQSLHHDYAFTGSFYNPGPYACYLAVTLPVAVNSALFSNNKFQKSLGTGMVLLCAILIPASMSRTALAAGAIGVAVVLWGRMIPVLDTVRKPWVVAATVLIAIAGCGAYAMKKDSAHGRLLIWKVAAEAAADAPAGGVGWDKVAGCYGEAQEKYFASGRGSDMEKLVADAPEYVFNEYLQTAIAFGPAAALWMTMILAGGLTVSLRNRRYGVSGGVAAIMVVMLASYPLQFPLFVVTIGAVVCASYLSARNRMVQVAGCMAVVGSCWWFLSHSATRDVRTAFAVGHAIHRTGDFRKSNDYLLSLLPYSSDPMILNIIGKNYRASGMADSAEYYLKKSVERCPNRLYPHYLLMQLYGDTISLDPVAQVREARIIMTMKEKIPSPAVEEMRSDAEKVLTRSSGADIK